jgi:hypothetical protein
MISLRRAGERHRTRSGAHDIWHTFQHRPDLGQPLPDFGVLAALDEVRLPPESVSARLSGGEVEIVTYVHRGAFAREDSTGESGVLHAGEFQHMTVRKGIRHKETNASGTEHARVFRIYLRPCAVGLGTAHEQKRFPEAQRHNRLCAVASPDGREGSLHTLQDVVVYSGVLDPGRHIVHELVPGRSAWLHVISGDVTFHDTILEEGDGVGLTTEPSLSLTARAMSEILIVDLGSDPKTLVGAVRP